MFEENVWEYCSGSFRYTSSRQSLEIKNIIHTNIPNPDQISIVIHHTIYWLRNTIEISEIILRFACLFIFWFLEKIQTKNVKKTNKKHFNTRNLSRKSVQVYLKRKSISTHQWFSIKRYGTVRYERYDFFFSDEEVEVESSQSQNQTAKQPQAIRKVSSRTL